MIYLLKVPHQTTPKCLSFANRQEVIDYAINTVDLTFETRTLGELCADYASGSGRGDFLDPAVAAMAVKNAPETAVYRLGCIHRDMAGWRLEPFTEQEQFDAAIDELGYDLHGMTVYYDSAEAWRDYENADVWNRRHQGIAARIELGRELELIGAAR